MTSRISALAFQRLPVSPPEGTLQTFDGYFPALPPQTYTIALQQSVNPPGESSQSYSASQSVIVQGPEFTIDQTIVQNVFPPDGGSDIYGATLPFVVLDDPALPWERSLTPESDLAGPADTTPWVALLVFAEGEVYLQTGTSTPVVTTTVSDLLAANDNVLKPQLPTGWVSDDVLSSQCETITITGAAFNAVLPQVDELPYLAHCRAVNADAEGLLHSVLLANRLPIASNDGSTVRYYAHLVSLEGFASYLGPNGTALPQKPGGGGPVDVQLVSLYDWTFTSLPAEGLSFKQLITGLIASETATAGLALPIPDGVNPPQTVVDRLADGYAPLTFVAGSGDETFAWYRGPLSPVVPQPLPQVGDPPVDVANATTADELLIYLAEQGLFDLSYAAAWSIGRSLALADAQFAQAINATRLAANAALQAIAQKQSLPHLAGDADPQQLVRRDVARRAFARHVGAGLGERWTAALHNARVMGGAVAAPAPGSRRARRVRRRVAPHPRTLLARPSIATAVATTVGETLQTQTESAAAWLARLTRLEPLPFSYLVPNPAMLPAESIRFFYVDQNWLDALSAGATSIAVHHSGDLALLDAMRPLLRAAMRRHRRRLRHRRAPVGAPATTPPTVAMTGVLIRSQLVAGWPTLAVTASAGGAPMTVVRDTTLSPTVRLVLFDGVPDTVTLAEPYQGLQLGVEDGNTIYPRAVTVPSAAGAQLANASTVTASFRTPVGSAVGGVIQVGTVASALATAAGVSAFASDAVVQWNGTALDTTFVGGNQLNAVVPADQIATAGTASVTVSSGGVTSAPMTFTIDPSFVIDSVSPPIVLAGGPDLTLSVFGQGFTSDAVVLWNGTALSTSLVAVTQLTAAVSASLIASIGTATVQVQAGSSTTNSVTIAVVSAEPEIDSIAPTIAVAGGAGFTLFVYGSGFSDDAVVQWNGAALATTRVDDDELTAAVPTSTLATAADVSVTIAAGGAVSNAATFTVADANPTIGSMQPVVAVAGGTSDITLSVVGVNFGTDAVVQWNGTALTTTVDDSEKLTATVPSSLVASAGTASVTVLSNSITSNAVAFPIAGAQPVIGLLVPASAVAGGTQFTLQLFGSFGAGDFAIQMIKAPESQSFVP